MSNGRQIPTVADVHAAARVLDGVAHRTPIVTSRTLDALATERVRNNGARRGSCAVVFKPENLQRMGAFKFRGAYNAVSRLDADARVRGVVTTSSGNHAQALSLAARLHGVRALILMPEDAPASKRAATEGYGGEVRTFDRYSTDREALLSEVATETGMTAIHAYDHPHIVAGAGTTALELFEDAGDLDLLLVPTGGGGLLSGCALAVDGRARVIGVEPAVSDDVQRSLRAGSIVTVPVGKTIADGQQLARPGDIPFAIIRDRVADVVTVTDDEIVEAMVFLFERLKLVVEPSGASAVAALLSGRVDAAEQRVGVVLSGGNVDARRFAALTSR